MADSSFNITVFAACANDRYTVQQGDPHHARWIAIPGQLLSAQYPMINIMVTLLRTVLYYNDRH